MCVCVLVCLCVCVCVCLCPQVTNPTPAYQRTNNGNHVDTRVCVCMYVCVQVLGTVPGAPYRVVHLTNATQIVGRGFTDAKLWATFDTNIDKYATCWCCRWVAYRVYCMMLQSTLGKETRTCKHMLSQQCARTNHAYYTLASNCSLSHHGCVCVCLCVCVYVCRPEEDQKKYNRPERETLHIVPDSRRSP